MFWSYTTKFKYILQVKHDISEVSYIFTSGGDVENTPPGSSRVPGVILYEFHEWWTQRCQPTRIQDIANFTFFDPAEKPKYVKNMHFMHFICFIQEIWWLVRESQSVYKTPG